MPLTIVTYDLYTPGQKYEKLREKLENYPDYVHLQRSVWVIYTSETADQVKAKLSQYIDHNDRLFVGALSGDTALIYPKRRHGTTMLTRW